MLRVLLKDARPGMTIGMPIHHPDHPDTVLLREGFALDATMIQRLDDLNIYDFWIQYPDLDFVRKHVSPEIVRERGRLTVVLRDFFEAMLGGRAGNTDYTIFKSSIRELVRTLREHPAAKLYLDSMHDDNRPLLRHHCDVAFLSLLMGMQLEEYLATERPRLSHARARDAVPLGVAGMLHDVGMLDLDEETRKRWRQTLNEQDAEWRLHVKLGYERLHHGLAPSAASAVLHHHQHFDGSGFPLCRCDHGPDRGLIGREIHIFARIVTAADLFDRLRYPPDGSDPRSTARVLKMMQGDPYAAWIDPVVFCALLASAPAYPPGTIVTLSSGEQCAVTSWDPTDPCRPTVVVIHTWNEDGDAGEADRARPYETGDEYDLRECRDVWIVETEGQDVSRDNFYPSHPGAFSIRCAMKRSRSTAA